MWKLYAEEYMSRCSISIETADHLSLRWLGPIPISCRIRQRCRQTQGSCNAAALSTPGRSSMLSRSSNGLDTPPGLMSGPAWRAGPSCVVSEVPGKGTEAPPWSDIVGMGAQKPEAPRVWELGPMQAVSQQAGPKNRNLQP